MRVMSAGHPCWRARVPPGQGAGKELGAVALMLRTQGCCSMQGCFLVTTGSVFLLWILCRYNHASDVIVNGF